MRHRWLQKQPLPDDTNHQLMLCLHVSLHKGYSVLS